MKTLRHVWNMLCHNKLFSAIYIFGTALALATVTMFAVVMWNKVAPIYPEYNRSKTVYLESVSVSRTKPQGMYMGRMNLETARDYLAKIPSATKASLMADYWDDYFVQPDGGRPDIKVRVKPTDTAFFDIYDYQFLAGRPFSEAELESGLTVAVITDELSKQAFGNVDFENVIGRDISLDFKKYKVVGVVKQATPTEVWSYAHIIYPYTVIKENPKNFPYVGDFKIVYLSDTPENLPKEVQAVAGMLNSTNEDYELEINYGPVTHIHYTLGDEGYDDEFTLGGFLLGIGAILLVLLIVPALNLSGMISGRMEERVGEMGLRKSFGATRGQLLREVLWENLILTIAGGVLGFILAWVLLQLGISSLMAKGDYGVDDVVTAEMVFSPVIFTFVFVVCCILNIMSAFLPAYRSLRRPIVQSLKE